MEVGSWNVASGREIILSLVNVGRFPETMLLGEQGESINPFRDWGLHVLQNGTYATQGGVGPRNLQVKVGYVGEKVGGLKPCRIRDNSRFP